MDGKRDQRKGHLKEAESVFTDDDNRKQEEKLVQGGKIKDKAEWAVDTLKTTLTGTSSTTPSTPYRRSPQSVPAEFVLSVSANREPWRIQLAEDPVLPEQFFGRPASLGTVCPEAALMRAVLEDALTCFQKQFATADRRVQRIAWEAEEWLFDDDAHWLFSFVSICAVLGLEPAAIRQRLKRWRHSPPTTPQRKMPHSRGVRQSPRLIA